jgi:hypothetical protein
MAEVDNARETGVPIVLGVTGHRRIRGEAELRAGVDAIFAEFRKAYPNSPLRLLSSLAEGADQLCAEAAIAGNVRVIAPLPFPEDICLASTSFETDEGRAKFKELLRHPMVESFVVALPDDVTPRDGAAWERFRDDHDKRAICYANAGSYVVLNCQALIALWDGTPSDRASGTFPIVQFKLSGDAPDAYPWPRGLGHHADTGPVYALHCAREASDEPSGQRRDFYPGFNLAKEAPVSFAPAAVREARRGQDAEKRQFRQVCATIDGFNREVRALANEGGEAKPSSDADGGIVGRRVAELQSIRAAAARLARGYHKRMDRLALGVFALIFLGLLSFHLYAHWFEHGEHELVHRPVFLGLFLAFLSASLVVALWVKFRHYERKWLDFRSLAEALRVQICWCLAGIDDSASANYLQQVRGDLSWVRRAIRACSPPPHLCRETFAQMRPTDQTAALASVGKDWIEGQAKFFEAYEQYHSDENRYRRIGVGLAVLGWILAGTLLVLHPQHPPTVLLIGSSVLVVLGGLVIAWKETRLLSEFSRQYQNMHVLFKAAKRDLDAHLRRSDVASAQRLIKELGREALSENASWLVTHRAHQFELPVHG